MAESKTYPKGIVAFPKNEKAPSFVLGTIIITPDELVKWLRGDGKEQLTDSKYGKQLKLQLTEYQGKLSLSVDTWKPNANPSSVAQTQNQRSNPAYDDAEIIDDELNLPF